MNRAEAERRQSLEDKLFDFVLAHPRVWLYAKDLRPVAGDAWRSRIVQVRRRLALRDLEFQWNRKNAGQSAYMLREKSLGPRSDVYRQLALF